MTKITIARKPRNPAKERPMLSIPCTAEFRAEVDARADSLGMKRAEFLRQVVVHALQSEIEVKAA